MKVSKTIHSCQQCGYNSPQWLGRCPDCGAWNSFIEETMAPKIAQSLTKTSANLRPAAPITKVQDKKKQRLETGLSELDRVLGGGIVPGSVILLGGEPGIGKSTLLLQAIHSLSRGERNVLLISGEESVSQLRLRAERLDSLSETLFVLAETDVLQIEEEISKIDPKLVVIDSIQTVFDPQITSSPGSVSQVKECAQRLISISKIKDIPIFLIGHVTKGGAIAGPRILEHMVDTVLYFEGSSQHSFRIVRACKNRYGPTDEIAIFDMTDKGLSEVSNPSEFFLTKRSKGVAGSAVVSCMEGTRSLLVEIQALVNKSNLAYPRRIAAGLDYQRLSIITAVLERRAGISLVNKDIYVSVAGGIKIKETAVDLGIALAIVSADLNKVIPEDTVIFGEIGLSGELRGVSRTDKRLKEAEKLGFKKAIVAAGDHKCSVPDMMVVKCRSLAEAIKVM